MMEGEVKSDPDEEEHVTTMTIQCPKVSEEKLLDLNSMKSDLESEEVRREVKVSDTEENDFHEDDVESTTGEFGEEDGELIDDPVEGCSAERDLIEDVDVDAVDGGCENVKKEKLVIERKELECQFFGSFYNEKQMREPVIDLVTFTNPCRVTEIRIIPLGATVEMLDGVALLGSTNPTNFELECYYEDLTDPANATFKELMKFTYDHKLSIHFSCDSDETMVITNKVLVRGIYNSITLAVFGHGVENFPVKLLPPKGDVLDEHLHGDTSPGSEQDHEKGYVDWDDEDYDDESDILYDDDENSQDGSEIRQETESCAGDSSPSLDTNDDVEMKSKLDSAVEGVVQDETILNDINTEDVGEENKGNLPTPLDEKPGVEPCGETEIEIQKCESEKISSEDGVDEFVEKVELVSSVESLVEERVDAEMVDVSIEIFTESKNQEEASIERSAHIPSSNSSPPSSLLLDTEDISDGDISSLEEESSSQMKSENESEITTLPKSGEEQDLDKQVDNLSEIEFDDDFEGDLEVISDEEIRDEEFELDRELREDEAKLPEFYGRPFDLANIQIFRPQNIGVDFYPKFYSNGDNSLHEKLNETFEEFGPSAFKEDMLEQWVDRMEEMFPILCSFIRSVPTRHISSVQETLLHWVRMSYRLEPTRSPESVTRNLRQLKVALMLTFHLYEMGGYFIKGMNEVVLNDGVTVQQRVAGILMESPIPTIQCLSSKVLESTLNTFEGFVRFISPGPGFSPSLYELLISEFLNRKLNCLIKTAIEPLFEKLCLIGILGKLGDIEGCEHRKEGSLTSVYEDLSSVLDFVRKIEQSSSNSTNKVVRARIFKYLPEHDSKVSVVKLFQEANFLGICFRLLSESPSCDYKLVNLIVSILQVIVKWEVGLVYLGEETKIQFLQKLANFTSSQSSGRQFSFYLAQCITVLGCVDTCKGNVKNLRITNAVEVMESLFRVYLLLAYESGRDAITHVFTTGNFIEPLLECIKLVENLVSEGDEIKQLENSAIAAYVLDLLAHVLQTADRLSFLSTYGGETYKLVESLKEENLPSQFRVLHEAALFLKPVFSMTNFSVDAISTVCTDLKSSLDGFLKSDTNWGISPEIVTNFRILDNLAISSAAHGDNVNEAEVIKYKLSLLHMNAGDILATCTDILKKLEECYPMPSVHAHTFVGSKGEALAALLLPIVRILRKIFKELIIIRNTSFRDLTLVPLLLFAYSLAHSFPENASAIKRVYKIKIHIIRSLEAFTIPVMKFGDESEEELTKSIWTRMVGEIITFTMESPCNFIPGLTILSELQPIKLPVISVEELTEDAKSHLISMRKLWSAFLHGITSQFQEMIGVLSESTNRELAILLRRVCLQIADLSAASCLVACRGIMEPILNSIEADLDEKASVPRKVNPSSSVTAWVEGSHDRKNIQCSSRTARLLGFLNVLLRKSGVMKSGVMSVMRGFAKVDEKFTEFLTLLGTILMSNSYEQKPSATQIKSQGHVMSIFHSLCNPRINMFSMQYHSHVEVEVEYLRSNSFPSKENLSFICTSLVSFLSSQENILENVGIIRKIFYALNVLCDSDYCFYHLRLALSKNPNLIYDFIVKLRTRELENLEIVGVMELLEVIDSVLRFLKNLISPEVFSEGKNCWRESRKSILTKIEFRRILGWCSPETMLNHPFLQLYNYLSTCIAKEKISTGGEGNEERQYLKTYLAESKEKLDQVLNFLNTDGIGESGVPSEVVLNPVDSLQDQFTRRPVVLTCEFQDESSKLEYITLIERERDGDFEFSSTDLIFCDLISTATQSSYISESAFMADVEKVCSVTCENEEKQRKQEMTHETERKRRQLLDVVVHTHVAGKSNFIPGLTGRHGFGRGLSHSRPNFDPFRSRPPNTSRPPSLHVDEFLAMASSSQGSSSSPRGRNAVNDSYLRGRVHSGTPSPRSRSFNTSERGRGYRSNPSLLFYSRRNESSPTSRPRSRGRGVYSVCERWPGDHERSPSSNYGIRQDDGRDSSYGDRSSGRQYGGRGGGYRDSSGKSTTPGSNNSQRWRVTSKQFNR